MKLDSNSKSIDLTQEEKEEKNEKKKQESVYEEIVREFGSRIKIMKDLQKGQPSSTVNFRTFEETKQQAIKIATKNDLFNTPAEVHRAAYYFGLHILWHLTMSDVAGWEDHILHETIMLLEETNYKKQTVDSFTLAFSKGLESVKSGLETEVELLKMCDKVLDRMPVGVQKMAKSKMRDLLEGNKTTFQLLYKRSKGQHNLRVA